MKKTIFSGIQPSGNLHLGNYLGAITQWVKMQDANNCIFCVVDYHAITVKQDPEVLKKQVLETAKIYLASGIDPKKAVIFQQSDISAHTELAWILNTITRMSDLLRMTQFKDKTGLQDGLEDLVKSFGNISEEYLLKQFKAGELEKHNPREMVAIGGKAALEIAADYFGNKVKQINNVGVGLFDYPALMAADILLYNTDAVPVGDDQSQHVELARTLARRFNDGYGEVFKIPELVIRKEGARIMGLDDPTKKMSKSASSEYNYIALTDDPEKAAKKIMKATTDAGAEIKFDPKEKPGISNLLTIYSLLADKEIKQLGKEYVGKGYGDFKKDVAEVVKNFLVDFQKKYNKISDKDARKVLDAGADKVRPIADKTLQKVKESLGVN